ncbi:MAG: hypothetical protein MK105_02745 [Crocinitomicaceae bacterium]|nr:hypothetical protein [Crocinitomicaceae bacterium]
MKRNTKLLIVTLMFSCMGFSSYGQIGRLTDAMNSKKEGTSEKVNPGVFESSPEKKVLKSPAKDEIFEVEASITKLDVFLVEKALTDKHFAESQENYASFMEPYKVVADGIPVIRSKDTKWKSTGIYEERLKGYEERSKSIGVLWEKTKKNMELIGWLKEKYEFEDSRGDEFLKFGPNNKERCNGLKDAPTMFPEGCPCAQNFREFYLKKMELPVLIDKINQLALSDEGSFRGNDREWLREMRKSYVTNYEGWESGVASKAEELMSKLESSKSWHKKSLAGLLEYHKEMLLVFSEINPSNSKLVPLAKEIGTVVDEYRSGQRAKYKWTEARSRKVFFLNENVSLEDFSDADIQREITLDEPVRFRWFFDKPAVEYHAALGFSSFKNQAMVRYKVYIDGKEFYQTGELLYNKNPEELYEEALTTKVSFLFGSRSIFYTKVIENLTIGKHALKIEILIGQDEKYSKVLASGEVTLNLTQNAIVKLLKNEDFCFPKSGRIDPSLEAKMLKKFNEKGWKEQAKKVIILDKDWTIVRNNYTGVIIKRTINALIVSTIDGACVKEDFTFIQEHNGSSYSSGLDMAIGSKKEMSCKCL